MYTKFVLKYNFTITLKQDSIIKYRRLYQPGGCYFFTVSTQNRLPILCQNNTISALKESFRWVKTKYPFDIDAIVILPDHIHCIWRLPPNDANYSLRWRLIKERVTRELRANSNNHKIKLWQNRFWEHLIRDEKDWKNHMDYIHYNPVKHGYVRRPIDWKHVSFKKAVQNGYYSSDWGTEVSESVSKLNLE